MVDLIDPRNTEQYTLKAMAKNYAGGHQWDKLDGQAVTNAANEIAALRAALAKSEEARETAGREVARCHERLEIDHHYVMGDGDALLRVETPMEDRVNEPDGVEARDATIQIVEASLSQALARIEELEKAAEWHPIQTAPKDGTEILLFGPGVLFVDGRTALYAKARHVGWWGHLGSEGVWLTRDPSVTCRATRWRPLPATPIDGGKG